MVINERVYIVGDEKIFNKHASFHIFIAHIYSLIRYLEYLVDFQNCSLQLKYSRDSKIMYMSIHSFDVKYFSEYELHRIEKCVDNF